MCITRKIKKQKKINKNKIYPRPKPPRFEISEKILCNGCNYEYSLESEKIQIHCAGCHKFYHCKIAGTCYGKNCYTETNRGQKHYLSWCINCVPNIPQNYEKTNRNDECICHNCYNDQN